MTTVKDIVAYFEARVPSEMKLERDNVGLLVGMGETPVKRALIALDVTDWVIDEAVETGAQIILSHHPLFFELKRVGDDDVLGRRIIRLAQNGISCLCQHTNLDQVKGGVNDALAAALGIAVEGFLSETFTASNGEAYGMGRFGFLAHATDMPAFLETVKTALNTRGLRYHDAGRPVKKVGVCGGTGGGFVDAAVERGCDTLVTADVKYSEFLNARARGLNIIDGDHFCTENVVVPALEAMLRQGFPDVEAVIAKSSGQTARFFS